MQAGITIKIENVQIVKNKQTLRGQQGLTMPTKQNRLPSKCLLGTKQEACTRETLVSMDEQAESWKNEVTQCLNDSKW